MKSPELLELTASEPLSLEEEYEMQRKPLGPLHFKAPESSLDESDSLGKWHTDEDSMRLPIPSQRDTNSHLTQN